MYMYCKVCLLVQPGFVLKAREVSTGKKVFINICQSENVQPAAATDTVHQKKKGQQWSIPYSLASPREDLDKGAAWICLF